MGREDGNFLVMGSGTFSVDAKVCIEKEMSSLCLIGIH